MSASSFEAAAREAKARRIVDAAIGPVLNMDLPVELVTDQVLLAAADVAQVNAPSVATLEVARRQLVVRVADVKRDRDRTADDFADELASMGAPR